MSDMVRRRLMIIGVLLMSLHVVTSSTPEFTKEEIFGLQENQESQPSIELVDRELFDMDDYVDVETDSDAAAGQNAQTFGLFALDHKNKTHEDTSCSSHKSCSECYQSSGFCHWCSSDNACHAKGSIYGCLSGVSCSNGTKPKENSTCGKYTTCSECTKGSSLCHWCGHDNACHMVGSVYGCMTGVDCYSNDRCLRKEPEYIDGFFYEDIGLLPLLVIFGVGAFCCCCATLAFCCVSGVKGAYDDLVDATVSTSQNRESNAQATRNIISESLMQPLELDQTYETEVRAEVVENAPEGAATAAAAEDDDDDDDELVAAPITNTIHEGYSLLVGGSSRVTITSMVSPRPSAYAVSHSRRAGTGRMHCFYNACRCCYAFILVAMVFLVGVSIRYYPKIPLYNVCNDAVAWKSIVDSMKKFKVEANFEILLSVMNNNHLDVAVDMGKGSFKHNGAFVGTFEIPPTVVEAMAITDVLVVATFTPEKWETLKLTKEYHDGTLAFDLDAEGTLRVPALLDFTYNAAFSDIHVKVNDPNLKDKHLCHCKH